MSDDERTSSQVTVTSTTTSSKGMASTTFLDDATYMEDLVTSSTPKSSQETVAKSNSKGVTAKKRQLSLMDMIPSTPSGKKSRTDALASSSPSIGRTVNGVKPFNTIPFNMDKFKESLSDDEKRLLALECETMGRTWLKVLSNEIKKPYFIKLKEFLWQEGVQGPAAQSVGSPKIFPPPSEIYNWSRRTPLGHLRVVIIGQDPYHGPGQAHGLCFSVCKGVPVPPSLKNMYKEIKTDYPDFEPPSHGDLSSWAESGVLLINTSLTVRSGAAGSHSNKGWETFTDAVIDLIDKYGGASLSKTGGNVGHGVVFMAWGSWAAKRVAKLSETKHLVLRSAHPSPLSAHRGFFGNGHFKKTNDWLEKRYGLEAKIDWCKLD
ncbi:hypothetical protein BS47DRAFT_1335123 [Hydnum rufescens UP504]|uniref:Uracil-DNA glycosylase n=1 Tax=Hydnum rufescens UP504 TaxID=1448309 RepID=A0A9P6E2C8_9AGAM|nr:hypothetical protein BS47DRAFT_1335123 [Hydnum rufescens UP504]